MSGATPPQPITPHDHGGPTWWDPLSVRPEHATSETLPVLAAIAVLVGSNVIANEVLPSWAYVPWNLAVAAALVWVARRYGRCRTDELGLSVDRLDDGLRWGGVPALAVIGFGVLAAFLPATRDLFHDDRARDMTFVGLVLHVGIEIPIGTVLAEETMFRGVLPAMFRRRFAHRRNWAVRADVSAALLFGLWHVLPSFDLASSNMALKDLPLGLGTPVAIAGSVIATTAVGMGFIWLRNRSGSLLAPVLLHWALNGTGLVIAWFVEH